MRKPIIKDRAGKHPLVRFACATRPECRTWYCSTTAEGAFAHWRRKSKAGQKYAGKFEPGMVR